MYVADVPLKSPKSSPRRHHYRVGNLDILIKRLTFTHFLRQDLDENANPVLGAVVAVFVIAFVLCLIALATYLITASKFAFIKMCVTCKGQRNTLVTVVLECCTDNPELEDHDSSDSRITNSSRENDSTLWSLTSVWTWMSTASGSNRTAIS